MKPFRKFLLISFCLLLSASSAFTISYIFSPQRPKSLYGLASIKLPNDFDIHFTTEGIAVSLPHTIFYSPKGVEIEPPFDAEDFINLPLGFTINQSTDNYLLINYSFIYSTISAPFEKVWQSEDMLIWDMKEFEDFLLLVLKNQQNVLVPYIFNLDSKELTVLKGLTGTYFLNASRCELTGSFSVLAFSDDGLFPSTRVFHYDTNGTLYGALTIRDSLYHNIYRIGSNFVLVGASRVICYNVDGMKQWIYDIPNASQHSKVLADNKLWLYFYNSAAGFSSALRVDQTAQKKWSYLPNGLSSLQSYYEGFLGVLNHNEILVFDSDGNMTSKFDPNIDIARMFWNKDLPDYVYLLDLSGGLFVYTFDEPVNKEDSQ